MIKSDKKAFSDFKRPISIHLQFTCIVGDLKINYSMLVHMVTLYS